MDFDATNAFAMAQNGSASHSGHCTFDKAVAHPGIFLYQFLGLADCNFVRSYHCPGKDEHDCVPAYAEYFFRKMMRNLISKN